MSDHMTRKQRSRAMSRVRLKDGPLERIVQNELRRRGLRFKKHVRRLPGSPDLVFSAAKVAVFVDGDFWHGYRLPVWEHKLSAFWRDKLYTNRARDRRNFRRLRSAGWLVIRLWQHDVQRRLKPSVERIVTLLKFRRGYSG